MTAHVIERASRSYVRQVLAERPCLADDGKRFEALDVGLRERLSKRNGVRAGAGERGECRGKSWFWGFGG